MSVKTQTVTMEQKRLTKICFNLLNVMHRRYYLTPIEIILVIDYLHKTLNDLMKEDGTEVTECNY